MPIASHTESMINNAQRKPVVSSTVIGMAIFVSTEAMFFTALISAHMITKANEQEWPPWGQPRLPIETTAFNTLVLFLSGVALFFAHRTLVKSKNVDLAQKMMGLSILLGGFFVAFQGYEWAQLIKHGLTVTSSTYGGMFFLVIGSHAVHVLGALIALTYAYFNMDSKQDPDTISSGFLGARIFWYFVIIVWPILYFVVYLY